MLWHVIYKIQYQYVYIYFLFIYLFISSYIAIDAEMTPSTPMVPSPNILLNGNWGLKLPDTLISTTDCCYDWKQIIVNMTAEGG